MMSTIYKLNFDSGDFYIGKTTLPIHVRLGNHVSSKGKGSPLLEYAWSIHKYLGYEIIEENIPEDLVNATERYYIKTLKPTLNTLPGGEGLYGLNHPRSKYSEEQLVNVATMLIETTKTYLQISEDTGVLVPTIRDIVFARTHGWLIDRFTEEAMVEARDKRKLKYIVYDIDNIEHIVYNSHAFKEQHGVDVAQLHKSKTGVNSKGWSVKPHQDISIFHDEFGLKTANSFVLKEYLTKLGFSRQNISSLFTSKKLNRPKNIKGWKLIKNLESTQKIDLH